MKDALGDRCRGTLPVEDAREVLGVGPGDLFVEDGAADPVLAKGVDYTCWARQPTGEPDGRPYMRIEVLDALQDPGLFPANPEIAPLENGWIGSYQPGRATMLLSCPDTVSGNALLVHVESSPLSQTDSDTPPAEEDLRFAAVAADIATAVGEEWVCPGRPGQPPPR